MRPIRTALFAPGSNERVMAKAIASGADAVILDLEDSVSVGSKAEARGLVARAIDSAHSEHVEAMITVRVNAAGSGLLRDDLDAIVRPGLDAVFLPKAESVDEVGQVTSFLEEAEPSRGVEPGTVEIVLMIESALGVYRCFELLKQSQRVATACVGSARDGDLQGDLGSGWSSSGPELMYAKSKVLLDTRAAGKSYPLDGVYADLNDEAGLISDSKTSASLGYVGRTVIHPKQIEPVRHAYAVPAEQVSYYRRVVEEFGALENAGTAVTQIDGRLVDYAMYDRAKRVLELAKLDR